MPRHKILVSLVAAMVLGFVSQIVPAHAGVLEEADSLSCAKVKDAGKIVGGLVDLNLSLLVATPGCTVKKVALLCTPTSIGGGDDPRGGPVDALGYLCFKAKCPGNLPISGPVETRFGASTVNGDLIKGVKQICVPYSAV